MKTATIRDVARLAGVGLGTVSRVLNASPGVSEATRQRVLAAIDELNFVPNPAARKLSVGRTLNIAVIVPYFTRPSFIERLRGIESRLSKSEYNLTLFNVETPQRRDACIREVPRGDRVDGMILISLPPRDDDLPYLAKTSIPIVLVDANHPSLFLLNRVIVDDIAGGRLATQHLIELGHQRIGYISDLLETPFNFTSSRFRYEGYRQALNSAGLEFRPEYHAQGEHGRHEACLLALRMLTLPERPTAVFAASDTQAMGVLQAAQELGLRIPEDISLVGYDDIEVAEYLGLTTIRQQLFSSGWRGMELLLSLLENQPHQPVCETMPTELIIRKTTSPIRVIP
ncbi:MAG: LacI family transcriptional regulator [Anaerolineales bacterium]|jgi:DNA-binding LacI/PurR family transcriptional regulator|nr:LacI family transcriptional regulator [Anaerolineales bacterium]